jgi:uncharacterized damage-inducible protein DinB
VEFANEYFQILFDYNYWGRDKILQQAANVTNAELTRTCAKGYGSLRATLVHCLRAEWNWLARWQGISPTDPPREELLTTINLIRERWEEVEGQVRAFLKNLDQAELSRVIRYSAKTGETIERPLWHSLTQIIEHGIQHRAEAAALLTEFDHSPGNLDFIIFLDERAR